MEIKIETGSIQNSKADTIIVNLFEGVSSPGGATAALDEALGGTITDLIAGGDISGKAGEVMAVYPGGKIAARRRSVSAGANKDWNYSFKNAPAC